MLRVGRVLFFRISQRIVLLDMSSVPELLYCEVMQLARYSKDSSDGLGCGAHVHACLLLGTAFRDMPEQHACYMQCSAVGKPPAWIMLL